MKLKKIRRKNSEKTKKQSTAVTRIEPAENKTEENMFHPKVAYRVLFGKKKEAVPAKEIEAVAPSAKKEAKDHPKRDRILKNLGIVGSIIACIIAFSGITLALTGLLAVIIVTIDRNSKLAEVVQKIYGGNDAKQKKKKEKKVK